MLQGLFGYTSLIHYDVERSFGVVPAPMVTFAMGYPVLISAISLTWRVAPIGRIDCQRHIDRGLRAGLWPGSPGE